MLSPHAITMSSSKNKKDKDRKPSRKDLAAEVEDLRAKLDKRKGQVRKLNKRLDALSLELRKSLLALGKNRTAPAHPPANPAPHLSPGHWPTGPPSHARRHKPGPATPDLEQPTKPTEPLVPIHSGATFGPGQHGRGGYAAHVRAPVGGGF
jgi:hypothetical protein